MSEYGWLQSLVAGLLTGGTSAGTTFLTVFKDIKKRLQDLETKVGSDRTDPKTGMLQAIETLSDQLRRMRREIDGWADMPPEWAIRNARRSTVNTDQYDELERRMEQKFASFARRLQQFEDDLSNIEARFVSQDRYDEDSRRRAVDFEKIKDAIATAASWQRGILAALGYVDVEPTPTPKINLLPPKKKP